MSGQQKKDPVLCDYCLTEKDANQIYTTRKQFLGLKVIDILQVIIPQTLPTGFAVKLCSMCASTLHVTSGVIAKTEQMINKLMPVGKKVTEKKGVAPPDKEANVTTHVEIAKPKETQIVPATKPKETDTVPAKKLKETETVSAKKQPPSTHKAAALLNGTASSAIEQTPSKEEQQSHKDAVEVSLTNAVKLTPAKEVAKSKQELIQLFGASTSNVLDSDEDEEEDDNTDVVDLMSDGPTTKDTPLNFECKLCDFKTNFAMPMKKHLKQIHGQQRPRIYNCEICYKSFGLPKTLKTHLLCHDIVEEEGNNNNEKENKPATPKDTSLAVLTPLNAKTKEMESVLKNEYTFAITGTNSSTPKQGVAPIYPCEICQVEMTTVKAIQEHLKTIHHIDKPKIFKCTICNMNYMHKLNLENHIKKKHGDGQEANEKIPAKPGRRKTIDERPKAAKVQLRIPVRRQTTDVQPETGKLQNKSPEIQVKNISELVAEVPVEVASPKKNKDKAEVTLKKSTPTPKKPKNLMEMLAENFEVLGTPSKKSKEEQLKPASPTKKSKEEQLKVASPSKKSKEEQLKVASPSKKSKEEVKPATPNKKEKPQPENDVLDSPLILNGKPTTKAKRKSVEEIKELEEEVAPSPSQKIKKSKLKRKENPEETDIIELFDEINTNVVPHKRARLESINTSDLSQISLNCSQCNKVVVSRKRLDSHIRKKHKNFLHCPRCQQNYPESSEYISHFAECDDTGGIPCGVKDCDKVFEAANYLNSHLNKKHKFNKS